MKVKSICWWCEKEQETEDYPAPMEMCKKCIEKKLVAKIETQ